MVERTNSPPEVALLLALQCSGRSLSLLSREDEELIDALLDGVLSEGGILRAAQLIRANLRAAERVLEHRLLEVANQKEPLSAKLAARILWAGSDTPRSR
jgi:hypothetical protein